jgi:phage baseplate assembly protein gpV
MLQQAANSHWAINQGSSFPYLTGVSNTEPQGTVNIVLQLGIPTITVDGITTLLDAAPEIHDGHTFLPIRPVVLALGGSLTYDPASKQLTITCNGTTIVLVIGRATATVNGQAQTLDAAPYVSNGRTMLPLRFIAQNLGCQVAWDGATRQATVSYPQSLFSGS